MTASHLRSLCKVIYWEILRRRRSAICQFVFNNSFFTTSITSGNWSYVMTIKQFEFSNERANGLLLVRSVCITCHIEISDNDHEDDQRRANKHLPLIASTSAYVTAYFTFLTFAFFSSVHALSLSMARLIICYRYYLLKICTVNLMLFISHSRGLNSCRSNSCTSLILLCLLESLQAALIQHKLPAKRCCVYARRLE